MCRTTKQRRPRLCLPHDQSARVIDLIVAVSLVLSVGCSKQATYRGYADKPVPSLAPPPSCRQLLHTGVSARLEPLAFPYPHAPPAIRTQPRSLRRLLINIDGAVRVRPHNGRSTFAAGRS